MSNSQQAFWPRAWFLLGVSMLFTHELDAMTHAEWRVLPLTSWLAEELARVVFVSAHVPLFALILGWLTSHLPERVQMAQFWIALFLVGHAVLHGLFSSHSAYSFTGVLSNLLIFGAGLCGVIFLVLRCMPESSDGDGGGTANITNA